MEYNGTRLKDKWITRTTRPKLIGKLGTLKLIKEILILEESIWIWLTTETLKKSKWWKTNHSKKVRSSSGWKTITGHINVFAKFKQE